MKQLDALEKTQIEMQANLSSNYFNLRFYDETLITYC
jgi:hypothetical protein